MTKTERSGDTEPIDQDAPPTDRHLRPLVGLLAALAVALTSSRIVAVALPWFTLAMSGSASRMGLVSFCQLVPYVLGKALTGPVVDRHDPRRISAAADLASAAALTAVPLLFLTTGLPTPLFLALVAVVGAARAPGDLAKETMVPQVAEWARVPLVRATSLSGMVEQTAGIVGLSGGGVLVAWAGPQTALLVNAALFLMGSAILTLFVPRAKYRTAARPVPSGSKTNTVGRTSYRADMSAGLRFLRGDTFLLVIIATLGLGSLLDTAYTSVLLPLWAEHSGRNSSAVGLLGGVLTGCALGGSALAAWCAHRFSRRMLFLICFLLAGAPRFLVLGSGGSLTVAAAVIACAGLAQGFLNPLLGAVVLERIPRPMLGRVGGVADALMYAGIPFGGLLAGIAVAAADVQTVLLCAGCGYLLIAMVSGLMPQWLAMDSRTEATRGN
ncbi:MFS transporter [Streptomyces sp. HUAS MG91]|uniref:MFS transporter n=1 Tax=Streptomyces tabacisoli TaxID=3156398 RepID=A0AAU8J2D0_9ACTN